MIQYITDTIPKPDDKYFIGNIELYDEAEPFYADAKQVSYCIGFLYRGTDPSDVENWSFDHANAWYRDSTGYRQLKIDELANGLMQRGLTVNALLKKYITYANERAKGI